MVAVNTVPPHDLLQEMFWSVTNLLSETGPKPVCSHQFTARLNQPKATLSPKGVLLPPPRPGHLFLAAPLCQHNVPLCPAATQGVGSARWVIFQPDEWAALPRRVVS